MKHSLYSTCLFSISSPLSRCIRSSFSHFIQTLTQLDLSRNGISDAGAHHLAAALRNSEVSETLLVLHLSFLYIFSSISPLRSSFSHFIQTLTQLNLSSNRILDAGAQHLADALRNSKVSETLLVLHLSFLYLFSSISLHSIIFLSFHSDTHSTESFVEPVLSCRCTTSGRCTTKQRGE